MTRNMNTSQARVIDPILTTHAQVSRNAEMIGHLILPVADIPTRGAQVLDVIALGREFGTAQLVRDPDNYRANNKMALTGADKWSDPNSDPASDINEAKEQLRRRIGRHPTLLTLSPAVFNALKVHSKIKEPFKYTSADPVTTKMLAQYFDIEDVVVGKTVMLEENASADASDVWGNDAILSFRPKGTNYQAPSLGYTYRLPATAANATPIDGEIDVLHFQSADQDRRLVICCR